MARKILFKAKRVDNGELVEGYAFDDGLVDSKRLFVGDLVITDYKGSADDKWNVGINLYEVFPETLCQYTGLIDKNGKKIWENDVVEAWSDGTMACGKVQQRIDGTWIMYPAWQNKTMWYFIPNEFGETTVEVIGNIFDNPELLEGR